MFTVGHEIVELKTFNRRLDREGRTFIASFATAAEYAQCPDVDPGHGMFLAGRLAAKRAFVKAWALTHRGEPPQVQDVDLREIEVLDDGYGRPGLRLHGLVAEAVEDLVLSSGARVEAQVSIAADGPVASAVVLLVS